MQNLTTFETINLLRMVDSLLSTGPGLSEPAYSALFYEINRVNPELAKFINAKVEACSDMFYIPSGAQSLVTEYNNLGAEKDSYYHSCGE